MIFSRGGRSTNASARADFSSRSRCSCNLKMRTFPNCVAALHRGIERAHSGFVAMHKLAVDVDDQVLVLGIEFLLHLFQPMFVKVFVTPPTLLVTIAERIGNIAFSRFVGFERCRSCYGVVPMFCPDSIGFA